MFIPHPWLRGLGAACVAAALAGSAPADSPEARDLTLEKGEFDPSAWHALVDRFAHEDGVDYTAWKASGLEELDAFLKDAAGFDPMSVLGKELRIAFLLNVYNAFAARQILEHYPVESAADIDGFFDGNTTPVGDRELTLQEIEDLVAGQAKQYPWMALACAPGIRGAALVPPGAYTAANLSETTGLICAEFLKRTCSYNAEANVFSLPHRAERHRELLDNYHQGMAGALSQFLSLAQTMALAQNSPHITYSDPDPQLRVHTKSDGDSQ